MTRASLRPAFFFSAGPAALRRAVAAAPPGVWRGLRFAVEAAALLLAIGSLVKAALILAAPIPSPPMPAAAPAEAGESIDTAALRAGGGHPFRGADNSRAASSAPLAESALNIVLHGTWRGTGGGSAMVSAAGAPQRKVAVGEEIIAGVTLQEVQDEFVVISNNGAREAVAIANRIVDMNAPARAAETASNEAPQPMATLRDAAIVAPLTVGAAENAPPAERPADTIAAAAPHETD